ncbi:MAG: hypothetical protein RR306_03010 [Clostridia bacterium]
MKKVLKKYFSKAKAPLKGDALFSLMLLSFLRGIYKAKGHIL